MISETAIQDVRERADFYREQTSDAHKALQALVTQANHLPHPDGECTGECRDVRAVLGYTSEAPSWRGEGGPTPAGNMRRAIVAECQDFLRGAAQNFANRSEAANTEDERLCWGAASRTAYGLADDFEALKVGTP